MDLSSLLSLKGGSSHKRRRGILHDTPFLDGQSLLRTFPSSETQDRFSSFLSSIAYLGIVTALWLHPFVKPHIVN